MCVIFFGNGYFNCKYGIAIRLGENNEVALFVLLVKLPFCLCRDWDVFFFLGVVLLLVLF